MDTTYTPVDMLVDSRGANIDLVYEGLLINNYKIIEADAFLKNKLTDRLGQISPIFAYFIYSVDKNIRKYSRGKSGKYVFVWKYIAAYKRVQLAMKWIAKDVKFAQDRTIRKRVFRVLGDLAKAPQLSFA